MAAIPTLAEEDAKRPNRERERLVGERTRIVNRMKSCLVRFGVRNFKPTLRKAPERLETLQTPEGVPLPPNTLLELRRDMARLRFVMDQIKQVEEARAQRLEQTPQEKSHAMVRLLARVIGVGIETADMLVHEVLARNLRDRRAVARYAGLTGAPDESGSKRREKGLAKAGNARVRRGMIQLAWRFLIFQKDSALARWYQTRTASVGKKRKTMIVALARKLLIGSVFPLESFRASAADTFSMRTVNVSSAAWADMPPANSSSVAITDSLRVVCGIVVLLHSDSITLDVQTAPLQPLRWVPAAVNGLEIGGPAALSHLSSRP